MSPADMQAFTDAQESADRVQAYRAALTPFMICSALGGKAGLEEFLIGTKEKAEEDFEIVDGAALIAAWSHMITPAENDNGK
jgi:hypothetical protein